MAYIPHLRIQISGTVGSVEEWSTGWRVAVTTDEGQRITDPEALQATATTGVSNVVLACSLFHATTYIAPSNVVLDRVTITVIGANGRKVPGTDTVIVQAPDGGLPVAGTATPGYPPQIAMCYSTVTARPRGRGAKGRWFYPTSAQVSTSSFQIPVEIRSAALSAAKLLLDQLNATNGGFGIKWTVVVASDLAGTLEPVTAVRVGRALDKIRRRRNHVDEDYGTVALA